jgi:hypothetical protein
MPLVKKDVVVGERYVARLGQFFAVVRIDAVGHRGGWAATNLVTGRQVHIKSAQKLRRVANDSDLARYSQIREDHKQWEAERKAQYGY